MKYIFYGPISFFTALALAGSAYALDSFMVGGEEGLDIFGAMSAILGISRDVILLLIAVSIVLFVFWMMMIIHAIKNPIANKTLWIIFLLVLGQVAAIIYYFAVKRDFHSSAPPPADTPPMQ